MALHDLVGLAITGREMFIWHQIKIWKCKFFFQFGWIKWKNVHIF